jgi:hypothetical protein
MTKTARVTPCPMVMSWFLVAPTVAGVRAGGVPVQGHAPVKVSARDTLT